MSVLTLKKKYNIEKKIDIKNKIDSVIYHITKLKNVQSLYYDGNNFYPNIKEQIKIDNDIYFKLITLDFDSESKLDTIEFNLISEDEDMTTILTFIDKCEKNYKQNINSELGNKLMYFDQITFEKKGLNTSLSLPYLVFNKSIFTTFRTFKNIFFEQKHILEKRVNFFMNNKSWYQEKGIPYTLGLMLYGSPGTGKTSTIKTIANICNRHIINVHMGEIKTKKQINNLFFNDNLIVEDKNDEFKQKHNKYYIPMEKRLYVIEDIDCMDSEIITRNNDLDFNLESDNMSNLIPDTDIKLNFKEPIQNDDKLNLSYLLNIFDGTLEIPGRIIIITTNDPSKLDKALIRPGRIDMFINYKKCNRQIIKEMYESFYDIKMTKSINKKLKTVKDYIWSPAEINKLMFENFLNPKNFINCLLKSNPNDLYNDLNKNYLQ